MSNFNFLGQTHPGVVFYSITPDDNNDISRTPRSVYIGSAGNLTVVDKEGNEETFFNVPDGSMLSIQPVRIKSTNTTATNILGII